jgi:ribosome biogenesis SPOUT family RNA methylase Rps3
MTTDTAVGVTKLVVEDGIALEKIQYVVSNDVVASDECV